MQPLDKRAFLVGSASLGALLLSGCGSQGKARPPGKFEVTKSEAEWRRQLGRERYRILREGGTERAGSSPLDRESRKGHFTCAGCGLPLFSSSAKYDSGTGWPSFTRPLPGAVRTRPDPGLFGTRTEVHCRRCGGHLGHVFDDGPPPTGKRFCMNGLAMRFVPAGRT